MAETVTAWHGSNRAAQLPGDWPRRRAIVLERDGYRCTRIRADDTRCPEPATDVDHIKPGNNHELDNLTALCQWHHQKKSAREGGRAAWMNRPPKKRPAEKHPGAL
ncbi:HNH endonuclease [Stackebrandtia nassauensis]|uniref:HNH endonuclease n=1 Tax=Stackebrandtia nassauensis (strain DSM 44728 / CIP 108903 / NRRL B-16338 / NBRC 102104 / LLR-40K-21) TaxID=446470 RepID=D3Q2D3_STANL|nr:HNH endonuclease signature motif containing protein [Stackebrandtia nassauensis]ADD43866.1 HNH endonuclease [Stackebrandtia nassauensis DSM 44728]